MVCELGLAKTRDSIIEITSKLEVLKMQQESFNFDFFLNQIEEI